MYDEPTRRYPHGVLGDDVEYGALVIQSAGQTITVRLPQDRVFEDLAPRLADLDGDQVPEIVTIESQAQTGAQLAVYNLTGQKIAATPHIGTRNRWLAPAGIADLDGDGFVEIAYVDRPHLAKTLRIWRVKDGTLTEIATLPGLTNHRIGEDFISGGLRQCGDTSELILASGDWRHIISVRHDGQGWQQSNVGAFTGRQSLEAARNC
ncbi:FG-GAP-like repeat-containing protein [Tropicibacter sp. Alg240-R139]|uniref:FG-GAP-like repeat-containing protein n=1 Tax=Tropicibacter sp. Alg240-R139 TaxID=2305991 RepID=UPI0013E07A51|nr:FG-GAP-like repeat-containing protein [Tropicibacter sp. Alg240-R139]